MGGAPVVKAKNFKGTLKRLGNYLKEYKVKFIIIFILAIAGTVFSIVRTKNIRKSNNRTF